MKKLYSVAQENNNTMSLRMCSSLTFCFFGKKKMAEVLVSDVSSCELFNAKGFPTVAHGRRPIVGKLRTVDHVFDH